MGDDAILLLQSAALIAATATTGLVAGLFYAYSCSVMPGLRRTDDSTFVDAMRSINEAIRNGWFALSFAGALLFTTTAAILQFAVDQRPALPWTVAALTLYLATLIITGRGNAPLNEQLAGTPGVDHATLRTDFEGPWTRLNLARTVTSTAAFGCLTVALIVQGTLVPS